MASADWYMNEDWNEAIEAAFRAKLSRSRTNRPHYLRVQGDQIADRYPSTALKLIDEYFETGDEFEVPLALCVRAKAHAALGQADEAIAAYHAALAWEDSHPNLVSPARIEFPKFLATARITAEYERALQVLAKRFDESDHVFPAYSYAWNGANALIADDLGMDRDAREFAQRALRAAAMTESPCPRHRSVGLVKSKSDDFGRRIERIARRPGWRRLLAQITGRRTR